MIAVRKLCQVRQNHISCPALLNLVLIARSGVTRLQKRCDEARALRRRATFRRREANSGAPPVVVAFGDYDARRLRQFASVHGGALVEKWQLFGGAPSLFSTAAE
jgi:hypothetical protein